MSRLKIRYSGYSCSSYDVLTKRVGALNMDLLMPGGTQYSLLMGIVQLHTLLVHKIIPKTPTRGNTNDSCNSNSL